MSELVGVACHCVPLPLIAAVECPACGAPVFVPSDSDGEFVTCVDLDCGAELVTMLIDGDVLLAIVETA